MFEKKLDNPRHRTMFRLGYQGVAITLDNYILNPWNSDLNSALDLVERSLNRYSLACVIETGARFLLNPQHKHEPTLISNDAVNVAKQSYEYLRKVAGSEANLKSAVL